MKITSKNDSKILGIGEHLCKITQVMLEEARVNPLYKDITEQLAVIFEDAAGKIITRWYNLKGYELDANQPTREDEEGREVSNYAIGKDGKRKEDKDKTASALNILARLAFHCGFPEGEELDTADLEGKSVGIMIERDEAFGKKKVSYSFPATEVGTVASESVFQD